MKPLEVRIPHRLDEAEVHRRLDLAVGKARGEYADKISGLTASWRDDTTLDVSFDVLGTAVTSEVEILPTELAVRLSLPAMASLFAGQIKSSIESRLGGLLEAKPV